MADICQQSDILAHEWECKQRKRASETSDERDKKRVADIMHKAAEQACETEIQRDQIKDC